MLRPVFPTLITLCALTLGVVTSVAGAQIAAPLREADTDRPGGTYVSVPTDSAQACAAQCARDGLCLAWSYQPAAAHQCSLKAVVTPARAAPGMSAGLAARAPGFASLIGLESPSRHGQAAPALRGQDNGAGDAGGDAAGEWGQAQIAQGEGAPGAPTRTAALSPQIDLRSKAAPAAPIDIAPPGDDELLGGPNDAS